MTALQISLIILFSCCMGWIFSLLTLKFLFSASLKGKLATIFGNFFQDEINSSDIIEDKIADPALFIKLKPSIEKHVDLFLNEKLAGIFPLLYKFMGEKTLIQFKSAFMTETDLLFPVIIKEYLLSIKKELVLNELIEHCITRLPVKDIRSLMMKNAKREIVYFKLSCVAAGLLFGILLVTVLLLVSFIT